MHEQDRLDPRFDRAQHQCTAVGYRVLRKNKKQGFVEGLGGLSLATCSLGAWSLQSAAWEPGAWSLGGPKSIKF